MSAWLSLTMTSGVAWADCVGPSAKAGQQMFNGTYSVMQYCNGTDWIAMGGGGIDTLKTLSCSSGQIAKWDEDSWECATDDIGSGGYGDTLAGLSCSSGQVVKWNGSIWACAVDTDTNTLASLSCSSGQVTKWNGSAWTCATDDTGSGDNLGNHTATTILNMSSNKITNVTDPTANQDAATKAYVDANAGGSPSPSIIKLTSTTHDGNFGGIAGRQTWIEANGCSGYRVCTTPDVVRYIFTEGKTISGMANGGHYWLGSGCNNWTSNGVYGENIEQTSGGIISDSLGCYIKAKVLCCRW
ncbi:hypothetical protein GC173_02945 [bacterium]|nr:hypothetical protein [bacterium]